MIKKKPLSHNRLEEGNNNLILLFLWMQRYTQNQISFLCARVGNQFSEERDRERISYLDVLRSLQREVGNGKTTCPSIVGVCGIGNSASCGRPVDRC